MSSSRVSEVQLFLWPLHIVAAHPQVLRSCWRLLFFHKGGSDTRPQYLPSELRMLTRVATRIAFQVLFCVLGISRWAYTHIVWMKCFGVHFSSRTSKQTFLAIFRALKCARWNVESGHNMVIQAVAFLSALTVLALRSSSFVRGENYINRDKIGEGEMSKVYQSSVLYSLSVIMISFVLRLHRKWEWAQETIRFYAPNFVVRERSSRFLIRWMGLHRLWCNS